MKRLLILALTGVAGLGSAQALSGSLFYGGDALSDAQGGFGLSDQHGGTIANSLIYDDFTLASASNITGLYVNVEDDLSPAAANAYYEIRSGVSQGNGGTLLASGTVAVTKTATGRTIAGNVEDTYAGNISSLNLGAGTYWFCFAPDDTGGGNQAYVSLTGGANSVGTPIGDGKSYWSSTDFGIGPFDAVSNQLGSGNWDMSQGVIGAPVPEPASMAVLGLGLIAILKRRRK